VSFVDDRDVERQVQTDPRVTIFDSIRMEIIDDGVVVLTGKVTVPHTRESAAARAGAVPGVREVRNRIEVLPASPFDDSLRSQLARAIYGNTAFRAYASMPNPPIHIIVEDGRVTLEGVVRTEVDRLLAGSIARSSEALEVRNELRTPPPGRR
jgi:hyperosmotically inducible periplasmic protein